MLVSLIDRCPVIVGFDTDRGTRVVSVRVGDEDVNSTGAAVDAPLDSPSGELLAHRRHRRVASVAVRLRDTSRR